MDRPAQRPGIRSDEHQVTAVTDGKGTLTVLPEQRRPGRVQDASPELISLLRRRHLSRVSRVVQEASEGEEPGQLRLLYVFGLISVISVILWTIIITMGGAILAIWRLQT